MQHLLLKLDFIDWLSFKEIFPIAGLDTSLAEFCAQYSDVQTNWAYTYAGIIGIIILLIKKNKKWFWYLFLALYMIMSVTSVGMHTANYGLFEPGVLTTKLFASYIDMSLTELVAWCGVCSFAMEFYQTKETLKKRNIFIIAVTAFMLLVIGILTYEVFVIHDRPLYFGGGGAPMDGKTGGMSIAEVGCVITVLPILYLLIDNFKKMAGSERALLILAVSVMLVAAIITAIWGDNVIADFALGNFQGHSTWHMLGALVELIVVFWVDQRTVNQKIAALKSE
ncbi:MAG: hypothetical protein IJ264_01805 [Clostridia bacterium]|nr:hypothetical protein [Clostridia bacterium]